MKKKIIAIGILGMLLLTGLTTVSAAYTQNKTINLNTVNTNSPTTFLHVGVFCGFSWVKGIVKAHPLPFNEDYYYRLACHLFIDEDGRESYYFTYSDIPIGNYLLKYTNPTNRFIKPCELEVELVDDPDGNWIVMLTRFRFTFGSILAQPTTSGQTNQQYTVITTTTPTIESTISTTTTTTTSESMSTVETKRDLAPGLTPPDGSITLDPENPNTRFGAWYNIPVKVTFRAQDPPRDSSGLYCIKYRVITEGGDPDPEWEEPHYIDEYCTDYNFSITLDGDGNHTVEFQAADGFRKGKPINWGDEHTSPKVRIDMTPPTITLEIEKITIIKYNITAVMEDAMSGVYYVQFYYDDEPPNPKDLTVDPPLPYQYTYEVLSEGKKTTVKAEVCDYADNLASTSENIPYSINIDTQQPSAMRPGQWFSRSLRR